MNTRIKTLCTVPLPYPTPRVKAPNLNYARMLSVPYAGQGGELSSVLQYQYGHLICRNAKPALLTDVFAYIAEVEMRHLEILGTLICDLGGAPRFQSDGRGAFSAAGLHYGTAPDRLLAAAETNEKNAIAVYQRLMKNIRDEAITEALARIVKDEEHHAKIFRELISEIA